MKPSSPKGRTPAYRIGWFIGRAIIWFVVLSVLWVLLLKWVPAPPTFTMLTDENGWTRDWEPLERIDRAMVRAVIAAEDSKFCTHSGFDTDAIAEAMRRNASGDGPVRGGSTISQQVAKNVFLWQGSGPISRAIRKLPEAWFTGLIEVIWGKRRIMEIYLNVAETGIGTYGVAAGSERYFGHGAGQLTRTEAARIAAVLPSPQRRGAVAPRGFTRRYGNAIAARMGVVQRDGLDNCVYP
jgi:monofunctional biosynthetic peptidoglycan transglycosylase